MAKRRNSAPAIEPRADFWTALERIPGLLGTTQVWRGCLGDLLPAFELYLTSIPGEIAEEYPCADCGARCPRRVAAVGGGHEAVCPERRGVPRPVELGDLLLRALDVEALALKLAPPLRFRAGQVEADVSRAFLWRVGMSDDGAMPVYLLLDGNTARRAQSIHSLLSTKLGACCLIVPADDSLAGDALKALQDQRCVVLRLMGGVALHADGSLRETDETTRVAVPVSDQNAPVVKGVTMYDMAYAIDMDEELAKKRVAKWRRHHAGDDFPGYLGPHPLDSRKKLYNPTPLIIFLKKIDRDIQDDDDAYIARLSDKLIAPAPAYPGT